MRWIVAGLALSLLLASCEPVEPPPHAELPTLMALPTETETPPVSATSTPDGTLAGNATQLSQLGLTQTSQSATLTAPAEIVVTFDDVVQMTETLSARLTQDMAASYTAQATATPSGRCSRSRLSSIEVNPYTALVTCPDAVAMSVGSAKNARSAWK